MSSVNLLKEALESEGRAIETYEKALLSMAHEESKTTIREIIKTRHEVIASLKQIIEKSKQCPAVGH